MSHLLSPWFHRKKSNWNNIKKKGSEDSLKVEKIKIVLKETPSFGKIRGLLITEEILPLQECVEILASWYPLNSITWLTYCTNPEAWLSSK